MATQSLLELWRELPVEWEDGLSDLEIQLVEGTHGFVFPPDVRSLLADRVPVRRLERETPGRDFPNWRDPFDRTLVFSFHWPWISIAIDVGKYDHFWLSEWGAKPDNPLDRLTAARQAFERAPKLIPIYSHRYLVAEPLREGNPVLSVVQTDIIYYGFDLSTYLRLEFFDEPLPDGLPSVHTDLGLWAKIMDWD